MGAIEAFVQVARLGSIKAAADALSLSSPALTRRIQSLEQFVGTRLFARQHNSVVLNPQGQSFLAEVGAHLDSLALAVERASAPGRTMRLRLSVPSLFASQRLVRELPSLRERHPNLQVELDTSPNRLGRLNDAIDAAIVIADEVDSKLYSRFLERGRIVAIASRALKDGPDPVTSPEDLARVPVLLHRSMPANFETWARSVGNPALKPAGITYFDSGHLVLDAAAEGLGVAFMLESHLGSSLHDRLVRLFQETVEAPYAYWFVCLPVALSRRPVRLFHDWLFERFAVD